jgi:excisionase family DNA binding protein
MTQRAKARSGDAIDLFTIEAAAGKIDASAMHVYRLIAAGDLRAVDISQPGSRRSKTRIRSDDLAAYIEARTRVAGHSGAPEVA